MPKVPANQSDINPMGIGRNLLSQVTPENLLMAASTMKEQGRFSIPSAKDTSPNPLPKKKIRKLKLVK